MSENILRSYEGDVEIARAKLTASLGTLRSPETINAFTDDLKKEALDAKDALVDRAKTAAQSNVTRLVEDLKAKAAANPAATLAIGAGLAWHFIRHPPVASALVGLGAFSLWRTNASHPPGSFKPDYLDVGKQRLKEQAAEAVSKVKDMAFRGQDAVSAKAADLTQAANERVQEWSGDIRQAVEELGTLADRVSPSIAPSHDAETLGQNTSGMAGETFNAIRSATQDVLSDQESRDKLLLGVAGVAVAAALGIACQKRLAET
jgi:hypothetical protein